MNLELDAVFSRTACSNPDKLAERIDVPVSEALRNDLSMAATAHGMPLAEYARRLLTDAMWGKAESIRQSIKRASV